MSLRKAGSYMTVGEIVAEVLFWFGILGGAGSFLGGALGPVGAAVVLLFVTPHVYTRMRKDRQNERATAEPTSYRSG